MRYAYVSSTGKGFITHEDKLLNNFTGKAGDVWQIGDVNDLVDSPEDMAAVAWIARVVGIEKTQAEASAITNDVSKFYYTNEEYLRVGLEPSETAAILEMAKTDLTIDAIVTRFFSGGVDASSDDYTVFLAVLLSKNLLTQARHDVLLLGK